MSTTTKWGSLRRDRIKELREFMEDLPKEAVQLCSYIGKRDYGVEESYQTHSRQEILEDPMRCNTVGCVAGWACLLFAPRTWRVNAGGMTDRKGVGRNFYSIANKLLGIPRKASTTLFDSSHNYRMSDRTEAIRRLKDIEEKGLNSKFLRGGN